MGCGKTPSHIKKKNKVKKSSLFPFWDFIDVIHQEEEEELELVRPSTPPSQRPTSLIFAAGFHGSGYLQGWHIW